MRSILFLCLLGATLALQSDEDLAAKEILQILDDEPVTSNVACQIDINTQAGSPQPLYIRPGTAEFFHPSDRRGLIELSVNQQMEMFCVQFSSPIDVFGSITVECVSGTNFRFNGEVFDFSLFSCRNWPTSTAVRRTSPRCFNNGVLVDVGFQVNARFMTVFTSCHDPVLETNHYTQYQLMSRSDANQRSVTRPSWRQLDFFPGKNVDNLHTRVVQRQTIATILESQSAADIFIELPNSEIYLARGHMAGT